MKPCSSLTEKSEIAHEILAYLVENPQAQDTLDGIVDWWLLQQQIQYQTEKVRDALTELVVNGFIFERQGKDSRTHYRVNRTKLKRIRELLKQRSREL